LRAEYRAQAGLIPHFAVVIAVKRAQLDSALKNGRAARQGTCAVCGTKITVMGADKTAKA